MSAEIVSIFDHPKMKQPERKYSTDELYSRWAIISLIGTRAESERARTEYYAALLGSWPQSDDKPCDS